MITGYTVRSERFLFIGATLAVALAAKTFVGAFLESRRGIWLTLVIFVVAAGRTVSYAAQRYPYQGLPTDLEAAFDYLNRATPEDSVVVALGPQETMLLPVYTHNKTLLASGYTTTCDIPVAEMFERMNQALRLSGVDESAFLGRLPAPSGGNMQSQLNALSHIAEDWDSALWTGKIDWQSREWENFFPYYFVEMELTPGSSVPKKRAEIVARLRALQGTEPQFSAEADYLWVGPFERGLMTPKALKKLGNPLYENATISIYKVSA